MPKPLKLEKKWYRLSSAGKFLLCIYIMHLKAISKIHFTLIIDYNFGQWAFVWIVVPLDIH